MSTSLLLDQPNETLELICRNLCCHCQENSVVPTWKTDGFYSQRQPAQMGGLLSLCLVSRRLRSVAQPVLFHEFCQTYGRPDRLISFTRTVALHRPDLGAAVAKVVVYDLEFDQNRDRLSREDVTLFQAAAVRYGLQNKVAGQLNSAMCVGGYEHQMAWMLALLAHVPNLEQLQATVTYTRQPPDSKSLYQMTVEEISVPSVLPSVHRLALSHWDSEDGFHLEALNPFLSSMSGLRRLELSDCVNVGTLPPRALASVTDLRVDNSAMVPASIRNLLGACGPLVAFRYNAGFMEPWGGSESEFFPRHVAQALLAHGHGRTLRHLEIDLTGCQWDYDQQGIDIVLGDIRGLQVLDKLWVSGKCMYGDIDDDDLWATGRLLVDTLPRSLRRLAIFNTNDRLFKSLMALAAAAKTTFPRLKFADIHANWTSGRGVLSEEQIDTLLDTFNEHGVAFTNRHWGRVPDQYMQ